MKKILLTTGLLLAIATAVISGTLASYNLRLEPFEEDTVIAKSFVLTSKKTSDTLIGKAQKIAPGEKKEITFSVSNQDGSIVTETNMDVFIDVTINENGESISPLVYKLYKADDETTVLAESDQSFEYADLRFEAVVGKTENFVLVVEWPHNDAIDTSFQGDGFGNSIQITVSGIQSN